METLLKLATMIQLAAAAIAMGAALYLARFEGSLVEKLDKRFVSKAEDLIREEYAVREHRRFDEEFSKVWAAISGLQQFAIRGERH